MHKTSNDKNGNGEIERPKKARKKQQDGTMDGESDPKLMVTHLQMLEDEEKWEMKSACTPKM